MIFWTTSDETRSRALRSCEPLIPASRSPTGLGDAWLYPYTDFGEGRALLSHPVLRSVVPVGPPLLPVTFAAIIDTGGPITVVSRAFIDAAGDSAQKTSERTLLRLAGRHFDAPLFSMTLALHRGSSAPDETRIWTSTVAVLEPWPHEGSAMILGQNGFLDQFTVTFGPEGFAVEPGPTYAERFGPSPARDVGQGSR